MAKLIKSEYLNASPMDLQVKVSFQFCDFENEKHCRMVAELINHHISERFGENSTLSPIQQLRLVDGLASHPACFVLFTCIDTVIVGMTTCFVNFSTFTAKSYLIIHDLIVLKPYRQLGIGTALIKKCISIAIDRGFCKVTTEISEDNLTAKSLSEKMEFDEESPGKHVWTKFIIS